VESEKLRIRPAVEADIPGLVEISRQTWDGDDYLAGVARGWITEGGLYVGLVGQTVAGCARYAFLPGSLIWLEGLRVRPDFKGRGYGKALSAHVLGEARRLAATGGWNHVEFSTYYKNSESIGITAAEGFEVVERFSLVWKHWPSAGDGFRRIDFPRAELDCYPAHVPFGWRFPLDCPETREWLASRCSAWEFDGARFYHREGGWDFTLLRSGLQNPLEAAQGISRVAAALGMDDGFEVIIPEGSGDALQAFLDSGFVFWEEPHEPNMLVFRLRGSG
jgi:GNAT superfamily N-acetyltransferase